MARSSEAGIQEEAHKRWWILHSGLRETLGNRHSPHRLYSDRHASQEQSGGVFFNA